MSVGRYDIRAKVKGGRVEGLTAVTAVTAVTAFVIQLSAPRVSESRGGVAAKGVVGVNNGCADEAHQRKTKNGATQQRSRSASQIAVVAPASGLWPFFRAVGGRGPQAPKATCKPLLLHPTPTPSPSSPQRCFFLSTSLQKIPGILHPSLHQLPASFYHPSRVHQCSRYPVGLHSDGVLRHAHFPDLVPLRRANTIPITSCITALDSRARRLTVARSQPNTISAPPSCRLSVAVKQTHLAIQVCPSAYREPSTPQHGPF
ncbi:hypothetical protein AOQ84DRAFT_221945 [Glonium stellatum]|uniref:Uncharacterized protein n=1 Tax=Glonium stellatum TaxID=574774 RepID=A0A8E2FC60_9PEZI|nr:hypothetical protein AOQ84DRAFT_221945 [Glonium stellatum]